MILAGGATDLGLVAKHVNICSRHALHGESSKRCYGKSGHRPSVDGIVSELPICSQANAVLRRYARF